MSNKTKEKKKWSKKKKAVVITLSVIAGLLVVVIVVGLILGYNLWYKTKDREPVKTTQQEITLIAHRGFNCIAPENTAPAFECAAEYGFWGAECDIYRTTDGHWVITHDSITLRMMDKTMFIEKHTLPELMEMNVDNGANIDEYENLKICTFEEYLQICKDADMVPIIELKGENNTEHYDEVVNLVEQYGLKPQYISFHIEDLKAMRALTDAPLFYLVQEISDESIEEALTVENCGISFNGNKEVNFEPDDSGMNMVAKCIDNGLPVASWTIDNMEVLEKLVENGVTTITTNSITY